MPPAALETCTLTCSVNPSEAEGQNLYIPLSPCKVSGLAHAFVRDIA